MPPCGSYLQHHVSLGICVGVMCGGHVQGHVRGAMCGGPCAEACAKLCFGNEQIRNEDELETSAVYKFVYMIP